MSWAMVAVTAGSALIGAKNASDEQKNQKSRNLAAAEHNRYSNHTGRTMGLTFNAPSVMGGALQGGMAGFGTAQSFGGMGGGDATGAAAGGGATKQSIGGDAPTLFGGNTGTKFDPYGQNTMQKPVRKFY